MHVIRAEQGGIETGAFLPPLEPSRPRADAW